MAVYEEEVPNGMAITPEPSYPNTRMGTVPVTAASDFTTTGVDNRYAPAMSLTTMIAGSPTKVDYYKKYLGGSSETSGVMAGRSAVHESYKEIKDLIIRLDGSLSKPSQDPGTKVFSLTGTAKVLPPMKPSKGDMLVMPLGDGRLGLFQVNTVTKESLHKAAIFTIEFSLQEMANAGVPIYDSLMTKVISRVVYVESLLEYGRDPFVESQALNLMREGSEFYVTILDDWLSLFLSKEYGTSLLPQNKSTHDPFLHRFVLHAFDLADTKQLAQYGGFYTGGNPEFKSTCVLDAVVRREAFLTSRSWTKAVSVPTARLQRSNRLKTGALSFIDNVICPFEYGGTVDKQSWTGMGGGGSLAPNQLVGSGITGELAEINIIGSEQPLWHGVLSDDYYIFSKAFYEASEGQSVLEVCVWDYILGNPLNHNRLGMLVSNYRYLQGIDKFYIAPILALLLRSYCKGL